MDKILTIDLGSEQDPCSLAILENRPEMRTTRIQTHLDKKMTLLNLIYCRYLKMYELMTDYRVIVEDAYRMLNTTMLYGETYLLLDRTGVGLPVLQMFEEKNLDPIGINITSGHDPTENRHGWNVPKKDLASSIQTAFQCGRLRFANGIAHKEVVEKQLASFSQKINHRTKNVSYENEKDADHDDFVTAIAQGTWWADQVWGKETEYTPPGGHKSVYGEEGNILDEGLS